MPYIAQGWRDRIKPKMVLLADEIESIYKENGESSYFGALNYAITMLILYTIPRKKYHVIAGITGVLQNIITEFYRKYVTDYENLKIEENGDLPW